MYNELIPYPGLFCFFSSLNPREIKVYLIKQALK